MTKEELARHTHYEKDYSLLRPFDLEAAKRGEKICWCKDGEEPKYFVITPANNICANFENTKKGENLWSPQDFRMAPLAWVEGKPVYSGDVLYRSQGSQKIIATCADIDSVIMDEVGCNHVAQSLTWQKPKMKREGWIETCGVKHHASKEEAERNRTIGCQIMYAHWEE